MLGEINNTLKPAVYTQEKDWDDDPHRMFIFTNEAVLKKFAGGTFYLTANSLSRISLLLKTGCLKRLI